MSSLAGGETSTHLGAARLSPRDRKLAGNHFLRSFVDPLNLLFCCLDEETADLHAAREVFKIE